VLLPSHTAYATTAAVLRLEARPVFVDLEPDRSVLSVAHLAHLLEAGAVAAPEEGPFRAVIAVHLYGEACDLVSLQDLCARHGLALIEDCAQPCGTLYRDRAVGTWGDFAAFSFYPTKNLGAIGDGGAITTSDDELADRIRVIRQYGWKERYISHCEGVNSRLDEMQAAILRVKLRTLPAQIQQRREVAAAYAGELSGVAGVEIPVARRVGTHAYHLYVIQCEARDALMQHLQQQSVPVALHYPAAIHQQPGYAAITARSPALPNTERVVSRILTLPLHPYLKPEAVAAVCQAIRSFVHP
jgi:dTDP-4-amino-4,6-dideoxygalactose transaminase